MFTPLIKPLHVESLAQLLLTCEGLQKYKKPMHFCTNKVKEVIL